MKNHHLFSRSAGPSTNLNPETLRKMAATAPGDISEVPVHEDEGAVRLEIVVIGKSRTFTVTVRVKK
jgi:hypothetical protein